MATFKQAFEMAKVATKDMQGRSEIRKELEKYKEVWQLADQELNNLFRKLMQTKEDIQLTTGAIVSAQSNLKWFTEGKREFGTRRFNAYNQYLETIGYKAKVRETIDHDMDAVMNHLGDPRDPGQFQTKGLVIGDVQSGKTGNFVGLMNKAADAGYNVIIVTTGTIEKLRKQTQKRIKKGFGGQDKAISSPKIADFFTESLNALFLTSDDNDTKYSNSMTIDNRIPMVAVIKKNKRSLENLNNWFKQHNSVPIDHSLLFIDDEADNASINTNKPENDPTTINRGIRDILALFKRASYVGFTVTPYANILIDHQEESDLFPKDFIQVLDTPSDYMGAREFFDDDDDHPAPYPRVLSSDDASQVMPLVIPRDKSNTFELEDLPSSLKEAIDIFFLQNAIRDLRGDADQHRSMLVNMSHLIDIQKQVAELINSYVWERKQLLGQYLLKPDHEIHQYFKQLYENKFAHLNDQLWATVYPVLYESIISLEVQVVNAQQSGFSYEDYAQGARVIAVGGYALSRGLTLEGLSMSYIYRSTAAYDTLLQMGRWFGYRPDYDDLVYLYITNQTSDWYSHIYRTTEELKDQIKRMVNQHKSPSDYGLYIREAGQRDPLLITARNKSRASMSTEINDQLSGTYRETIHLDSRTAQYNAKLIERFISDQANLFDEQLVISEIAASQLTRLLKEYKYSSYGRLNTSVIDKLLERFEIFTLAIAGKKGSTISRIQDRTRAFRYNKAKQTITFANSRVGSPSDGKLGLSDELRTQIKDRTLNSQRSYFEQITEAERHPLILLYPERLSCRQDVDPETQVFYDAHQSDRFWAMGIGIPNSDSPEQALVYKISMNTVMMQSVIDEESLTFEDDEEDLR